MPQLDFSVFPSQLFWLSVTFFAMLFVMSKIIIPRIAEMINLRREKIDDYLEKSAEIKEKAEEALERYHNALKQATDEANQSLQKTQQDLKNMIDRRQADLSEELNRQISEGEKKIQASKEKVMKQAEEIAAELAGEVVKKLGFKVSAKALQAAVKETGGEK